MGKKGFSCSARQVSGSGRAFSGLPLMRCGKKAYSCTFVQSRKPPPDATYMQVTNFSGLRERARRFLGQRNALVRNALVVERMVKEKHF